MKSAAVELVCSTTVPGGGRSPPDISAYIMPVNSLILNSLFLQAKIGPGTYWQCLNYILEFTNKVHPNCYVN